MTGAIERLAAQAQLFDASTDVVVVRDLENRVVYLNAAAQSAFGLTAKDVIGRTAHELFALADDDSYNAAFETVVASGTWVGRLAFRSSDGVVFIMDCRWHLVKDAAGIPEGIVCLETPLADELAETVARQLVDRKIDATLNQIADVICFVDRDWIMTYVNRAAERLVGRPASDMVGKSMWDVYPGARDSPFAPTYKLAMENRTVARSRSFYTPTETWLEASAFPTDDGLALYLRDVSDDELNRQTLADYTAKVAEQAALLAAARDAIIVRDLDSTIRYWNRSAELLYGWTDAEAIGRRARDLLYDDPTEFDLAMETVMRDGFLDREIEQVTRDGRRVMVDCRWQLVRDSSGVPTGVFSVNTDITEYLHEQEYRVRAQRMESLGTLAGGIAHDLNNVLTPILMGVQLLDQGEHDESKRKLLRTMEIGIKRGADMIRQVLSFASGVEGERHLLNIDAVLDELHNFCRDSLPKDVHIIIERTGDLWPVMGDSTQILQVLINLATNARDAMPDGGSLTIRASNVHLTEDYSAATGLANPGRYVSIEAEDNGTGMPSDVASKVFEPFFTTKEVGKGTGLGLPTSMAIVRSHGGYMQVYTEPGKGTRFIVHLPAASLDSAIEIEAIAAELESYRGSGECILVIDDEASIRQIVRQTLEAHGYTTLVASNGREGIEIIENSGEHIDLVLTDMMMPVMDGAETAAYISTHHPSLVVIAASGLNANGGVARAANAGITDFIPKPFTTDGLLIAVRRALDKRGETTK
jgi:two-component system, cell cycle sensor histidine kinase and response regulator CckA